MGSREGSASAGPASSRVSCPWSSATMTSSRAQKSMSDLLHLSLRCVLREIIPNEFGSFDYVGKSRKCLTDSCYRFSLVFWKLVHILLVHKRVFVLLMLLNPVLIESSPTPRARHRHLRHTTRSDHLCEKPQVMDHPHDQECRRLRVRRDIHHMNLREGENSTMCDYKVCVDKNPNRMPQEIHRVFCVESGCRCQHEGSFRCTQLTDKVEVWYGLSQGQPRVDRVEVEVGCVCAGAHALPLDTFNPSVSVD